MMKLRANSLRKVLDEFSQEPLSRVEERGMWQEGGEVKCLHSFCKETRRKETIRTWA
jgi:hypothetical protein